MSLIYKDLWYSEQSTLLSQLWNAKLITGGINLELELFWWKSSLMVQHYLFTNISNSYVALLYVSLTYKDLWYSKQSTLLSQLWNAKLITGGINLELELFWWKSSFIVQHYLFTNISNSYVALLYVSLTYKDLWYSEQSTLLSQLWNAKLITGGINLELELFWWKSSLEVCLF